MSVKLRLILMNFLQYAIWGAYLTSMGSYLANIDLGSKIGLFYAVQGVVSLFMPALVGILADRWIPAQRMLGICHFLTAAFMLSAGYYCHSAGANVEFGILFTLYTMSVAFYMPTIALSNSVAYTVLGQRNLDAVKHFPPIRIFGTIGFICAMLFVNFVRVGEVQLQETYGQFITSGLLGLILAVYAFTMPKCPTCNSKKKKTIFESLGLQAFSLFKEKKMAVFFIFSMLLGASLQITNGYANPFIMTFKGIPEFADTFGANNANALISLSQMSETLCILLIPFFLRKYGIKTVMLISMFAWALRFGLLGAGDPGSGVWMFILSMIVYGVAFDFFNVSGSLYVNQETSPEIRSSAQGLFMMMTNGFGAMLGMFGAQWIVNKLVFSQEGVREQLTGWSTSWYVFAIYALVVAILFWLLFKYKHNPEEMKKVKL